MPGSAELRALRTTCVITVAMALAAASGAIAAGFSIDGRTMGTFYKITASSTPATAVVESLRWCTRRALQRIDALMSTWRDDSELARFNASLSTGWQPASPATVAVLREALGVSELTAGAFDPTVGPLLALWGFGPGARDDAPIPEEQAVTDARSRIGYRRLKVRADPHAIAKGVASLSVDLSALAKGYAVDALAALLEHHGVSSYLVNVGGEMRAVGGGVDGHGWRVGIESPDVATGGVIRVLRIRRAALATSGTYRRYRQRAGRSMADTIDPRSGAPVAHDLRAVSVLAPRAARADALATGLLVLGARDALALARQHEIAAILTSGEGELIEIHTSPAFAGLGPAAVSLPPADDTDVLPLLDEIRCLR